MPMLSVMRGRRRRRVAWGKRQGGGATLSGGLGCGVRHNGVLEKVRLPAEISGGGSERRLARGSRGWDLEANARGAKSRAGTVERGGGSESVVLASRQRNIAGDVSSSGGCGGDAGRATLELSNTAVGASKVTEVGEAMNRQLRRKMGRGDSREVARGKGKEDVGTTPCGGWWFRIVGRHEFSGGVKDVGASKWKGKGRDSDSQVLEEGERRGSERGLNLAVFTAWEQVAGRYASEGRGDDGAATRGRCGGTETWWAGRRWWWEQQKATVGSGSVSNVTGAVANVIGANGASPLNVTGAATTWTAASRTRRSRKRRWWVVVCGNGDGRDDDVTEQRSKADKADGATEQRRKGASGGDANNGAAVMLKMENNLR
ncbi:hypothetical protein R3P38DRAFT_2805641 [Favolaschia claudopus]|uniref:Uncharacterized protein n=1 Tax=Favolaschia claudopus TaxID=2862362 RepID=A0AAV9ZLZ0_9AGAR